MAWIARHDRKLTKSQPNRNIPFLPAGFMKIALVILDADPARGGAERYTIDWPPR